MLYRMYWYVQVRFSDGNRVRKRGCEEGVSAWEVCQAFANKFAAIDWPHLAVMGNGPYLTVTYDIERWDREDREPGLDLAAEAEHSGVQLPGSITIPPPAAPAVKAGTGEWECKDCKAIADNGQVHCSSCGARFSMVRTKGGL
jgi:hypothetical protein